MRTFVCDDIKGSVFRGKVPCVVAKKVARKLLQDGSATTVKFSITETTKDSPNKTFTYIGTKKILNPPKIVKRGNKEITISNEYIVKKA